jgi:hypothetical protein
VSEREGQMNRERWRKGWRVEVGCDRKGDGGGGRDLLKDD